MSAHMKNSASLFVLKTSTICCTSSHTDTSQRRRLYELYQQNLLTDVELVIDGESIAAHRVVLAAASPYFHVLFTSGMKESREQRIELFDINLTALRALLVFMYVGELQTTGETILTIMHTADQLEMLQVVEICCKQLIVALHITNCVDIYLCCENLTTRGSCQLVARAAFAMIESFLGDVMESESFLHLPVSVLIKMVDRQRASTHDRQMATRLWVAYDPETRSEELKSPVKNLSSVSPLALNEETSALVYQTTLLRSPSIPHATPILLAIGGFNSPKALKSVELLDFRTNEWVQVANMSLGRSYSAAVVTPQQQVVVLGGTNNTKHLDSVEQYDPITNTWTTMPCMHKARSYFGAACLDGYIYVIGGFNGISHLHAVERWNIETLEWEDMARLHVARSGLAVVIVKNRIYAVGGYDGRHHLNSIECYDPMTNTWSFVPCPMLETRNGPSVIVTKDETSLVVYGGEVRHGERLQSSERLDLKTMEWTQEVDGLVECRSGHVVLNVWDDTFMYCLGGSNKNDEYINTVHRYDALTHEWTIHSRMEQERCGLNVAYVIVPRSAACLETIKENQCSARFA